jgi:hypothetical protein
MGPLLCFAAEISASWQHWCQRLGPDFRQLSTGKKHGVILRNFREKKMICSKKVTKLADMTVPTVFIVVCTELFLWIVGKTQVIQWIGMPRRFLISEYGSKQFGRFSGIFLQKL